MEDIKGEIKQTKVLDLEREVLGYAVSFLLWAFFVTLFLVLFFLGWLLVDKNTTKRSTEKIATIDKELDSLKDLDQQVIEFEGAVLNIQTALSQKQKWSPIFRELNNVTPKDVFYSNFSADNTGKARIDGTTNSLSALAKLIVALSHDKEEPSKLNSTFKNVTLNSTSFSPGKVNFSLSTQLLFSASKEEK